MEPLLCNTGRERIGGDRGEEELRDSRAVPPVTLCPAGTGARLHSKGAQRGAGREAFPAHSKVQAASAEHQRGLQVAVGSQTSPAAVRSPRFSQHHRGANSSSGAPVPSAPAHPTHPATLAARLLSGFSQTGAHASLTANITAAHAQKAPSDRPSAVQTRSESPAQAPRAGDQGALLVESARAAT